jgi:hypothetical protein
VEAAVKQQSVDLRRFIVASLDSFAARMVADLRPVSAPLVELPLPPSPKRPPIWPWAGGLAAACLAAALCAGLWLTSREQLAQSRAELAASRSANADLQRARTELTGAVKDLTAALTASTASTAAASAPGTNVSVAAAGLPRSELVPYGEIPFDRGRLDVLRDVLGKLESQGFRGVVKVTSLAGSFCLTGNAIDGFSPAGAAVPVNKCDLVGNPFEESLSGQQRQSLAFANLVAGIRQRTQGAITVALENGAGSRAATPYPPRNESLTAGEWNRAAAANNRVEFAAEAAATP